MIIVAIGITALLMVVVFAALCLTDADAAQGPPPTLRPQDAALLPFGLTDGSEDYEAAWERHVSEALTVARDDFALWLAEMNDDRRRA